MTQKPNITIYGAHWCPDCRRSKQFLGEHQLPYAWVDIEQDKAGEQYVIQKNDGKRIIPTIEFADGSILVEPSNAQLAVKLSLKTTAERSHYDLIIVGGGPAGLTAALYTARESIDTLLIERAALGGQATATQWLDNVPGFAEGIDGNAFSGQAPAPCCRAPAAATGRWERPENNVISARGCIFAPPAMVLAVFLNESRQCPCA